MADRDIGDYMKASKKIMKLMFDKKTIKRLKQTALSSFDWNGLDISETSITGTFPNIKERFDEYWISSFKQNDMNALDVFLQVVFHYGFQAGADNEKGKDSYFDCELKKYLKANDS